MRDGPHIGDGSDNELTDVRRLHSDVRQQFASYLSGSGIEIGPGHTAFPVPPGVDVRYVDRWSAAQQRALFPELADSDFRERDFEIDLDLERLSAFAAATQDFVIASHILEHLANPLAMVQEIHRVLRSGGLLVLLLPDYHVTFDRGRKPTSIEHLVDEYRRDVCAVDDEHLADFILAFTPDRKASQISAEEFDLHRRRSIHVHVWDQQGFREVLDYAEADMGIGWNIVDSTSTGDPGTEGNEFGWVLRRC